MGDIIDMDNEEQTLQNNRKTPSQTCRCFNPKKLCLGAVGVLFLVATFGMVLYMLVRKTNTMEPPNLYKKDEDASTPVTIKLRSTVTIPTTVTPTDKPEKVTAKEPVYGHLEPEEYQDDDDAVQWSAGPPTWTSHDMKVKENGRSIFIDRTGVYNVAISICILCHETDKKPLHGKVALSVWKNAERVKKIYGAQSSTLHNTFLLKISKGDELKVTLPRGVWTPRRTKTYGENTLDLYLVSEKIY